MPRSYLYGLIASLTLVIAILAYPTLLRLTVAQALSSADLELLEVAELKLSIHEITSIRATGVRLRHADAKIEIGDLTLGITTASLLPGRQIELRKFSLSQWDIAVRPTGQRAEHEESSVENLHQLLTELLIDFSHPLYKVQSLELGQGNFIYQDLDQNIELDLTEFTLRGGQSELSLTLNGVLNQAPVKLGARLGRERDTTRLIGSGEWQQHKLSVSAQVNTLRPLTNLKAELLLSAPEAKPLLELLGAREVRNGVLQVRATLGGENDQFESKANITIGDLKFNGDLDYEFGSGDFALEYFASGPSLQEAGALLDYLDYQNEPFETTGILTRNGTRVQLANGRIRLGPGEFRAAGILPDFPALTDWALELSAERFDIKVLQPFVPCELPQLDLTWIGRFSTNPQGREIAELKLQDEGGQQLITSAVLGDQPDYLGTSIRFEFDHLLANQFTQCGGINLKAPLLVKGHGSVSKTSDAWQLDQFALVSDIAEFTARPRSNNEILIDLKSADITQLLNVIPDTPELLTPNPLDLAATVTVGDEGMTFTTSQMLIGSSVGTISISRDASGRMTANASLEGDDLVTLVRDTPFNASESPLPFSMTLSANLEEGRDLKSNIALLFADNRLDIQSQIDLENPRLSPVIEVQGGGPSLETMFGPFVPHTLPDHEFDIAFRLKQNETLLDIEALSLNVGSHTLTGNLRFSTDPNVERTTGQIQIQSPSSLKLLKLFGQSPDVIDAPVQLKLNLDGSRGLIHAEFTESNIGESHLAGRITLKPGDIPVVNVDLTSNYLHLPTFLPGLERATDDTKDVVVRGKKVIPEVQIPWHIFKDISLDFDWKLHEVLLKQDQKSQARIAFQIEEGRLTTNDISWKSELNNGRVLLLIDTRNQPPNFGQFRLDVISERIPVMWLYTGVPTTTDGGKLAFHAKLNSFGSTATDLGANLDGAVLFRGGSGQINSSKLDTLFGDFLYQLSSMAFGTGDQQTKISCTGGGFYIRNGKINMDPGLAVRTSRFDILASGQITLPDEKLKLNVNSRSRQGIGVSAASTLVPSVGISGILSKPQFNLNARDTAITGGAAIATSGLSILATGIWDRIRSSVENPCDALVEKAKKDGAQYFDGLNSAP